MNICNCCGGVINTPPRVKPITVQHFVNNNLVSDSVVPFGDAFYQIVSGKRKDGLIHIFNVKKEKSCVKI